MTLFKGKYRIETIRLPGWDYTAAGWYFVTICTRAREPFFGCVENGEMHLSAIGQTATAFWRKILHHTVGDVMLDAFVVMPNHIHGIVVIGNEPVRAVDVVETLQCNVSTRALSTMTTKGGGNLMSKISPRPGSLGAIIRSYKSAVTRWCRKNGYSEFGWQARFYDHVIRDEESLNRIRQYIRANPSRRQIDRNYSGNL